MPPALPMIAFAVLIAAALVQLLVLHVLWQELWFGPMTVVGRTWGGWLWPRAPHIAVVSMLSHALAAALLLLDEPAALPAAYGASAIVLAVVLPIGLRRLARVASGRGRHRRDAPAVPPCDRGSSRPSSGGRAADAAETP